MSQQGRNRLLGALLLGAAFTAAANEPSATFVEVAVRPQHVEAAVRPQHMALGAVETAEPSDPEALVDIPDAVLRRALEEELDKEEDEPITRGDMASLSALIVDSGVDELSGLEHAINLGYLALRNGGVSDLTPLAELESLTDLVLPDNVIVDVAPLAGLQSLTQLYLVNNAISNVAPLAGLQSLIYLSLSNNAISDVTPLAGLQSLTELSLSNNAVSDLAPLADLQSLTALWLSGNAVSDVAPLAGLQSLTYLLLSNNAISDVAPLADLQSLTDLWLNTNAISDLAPLAGLQSLTKLYLAQNAISDISPLAGLKSLTLLQLGSNAISNIAPLAGLQSLTVLYLYFNNIEDISPLANLRSLTHLWLYLNNITDIAPLASLQSLTSLLLGTNAISDIASLEHLRALTRLSLMNNNIANITPLAGLHSLARLDLSGNVISDIAPLANLRSLTYLSLLNDKVSDLAPLAGLVSLDYLSLYNNDIVDAGPLLANEGLGKGDSLDLRRNLLSARSLDTDVPTLQERGVDVMFDALQPLAEDDRAADIADPAMRTAIERALNKGAGWPIGVKEISAQLTELELRGLHIEDLTGLEHATKLEYLDLGDNSVTDLALLEDLSSLRLLYLDGNEVFDIASLAELPLAILSLKETKVEDLTPLSNMESLYWLALDGNSIRDLPPLPDSLHYLYLTNNAISDIGVLADLSRLREVRLSGNSIRSVAPLGGLSQLAHVFLNDNRVRVLGPLNMESLVELHLRNNAVRNIEPLRQGQLAMVDVRGNPLAEASANVHAPALRDEGTTVLMGRAVPYFPAAGSGNEGFVRVVNRGNASGEVFIEGVDDAGVRFGPESVRLGARRAFHFDSSELQDGHAAKGFAGIGPPTVGDWRLEVASALDIEVLSYVRAEDGLVTPMHDIGRQGGASGGLPSFGVFDSADGVGSILRVVNTEVGRARWTTGGYDDSGHWRAMANAFLLPGGSALTFTGEQLREAHGLGEGGRHMRVRGFPWFAQNLYANPTGHLTNLSTTPTNGAELLADGASRHRVPLLPAAAGSHEGLVRVINRSATAGEATIEAIDDEGNRFGAARLALAARQAVVFSSADLEYGNDATGLTGTIGPGEGHWRLALTSALDLQVLSYVRSEGGFVSAMHDLSPLAADGGYRIVYFNPGSNRRHVSTLRLANNGERAAAVSITGTDDRGAPSGTVTLTVPALSAVTFTSAQLESGGEGLAGSLGDGYGKWRLRVESDRPLAVMSLVESREGYLVNVSTGTAE